MRLKDTIVGTGSHRYRVVPDWARLPAGESFGVISAVAVDKADRVYVYSRSPRPVDIFDREGNFVDSWGEDLILDAHGLHIAGDNVYLTDRDAHEVIKLTLDGQVLMRLGTRHTAALEEPFNHPTGVAVAPDGEIYVSDGYANSRVHRFSADGRCLASWGSSGTGPGQFRVPHDVWVTHAGLVYVCDRDNFRVQVFDRTGALQDIWRDYFRPTGIYGDDSGTLYITDLSSRLSIVAPDGRLLSRIRIMMDGGHSVWGDSQGNLYITEIHQGRLDKYELIG